VGFNRTVQLLEDRGPLPEISALESLEYISLETLPGGMTANTAQMHSSACDAVRPKR
jgi:hypothetical protein